MSLVDELCDLLDLSPDSVYRRIRGEKPITLNELKRICEHYHFSIDKLLHLENETVLFQAPGVTSANGEHSDYLQGMLQQFKYFNSFKSKEIQYLCKDVPFWYFYLYPEMAAFKTFFWSRTINNHPSLANKKFSLQEFPFQECYLLGQQLLYEFNEIPSVELWNLESINSTINQVAYYKDAGLFTNRNDFEMVVASFLRIVDHLQAQAELGVKFIPGTSDVGHRASLQFYVNELILGNNTILISLDNQRVCTVTYSVLSYLMTKDDRFAAKAYSTFNTLLSRATLISKTGEKDRNRFFNALREKVEILRSPNYR